MSNYAPVCFYPNAIRTERDIEYDAFLRVTSLLKRALTDKNPETLMRAVNENTHLWTSLLIDLSLTENLLRDEVKAGIISIGLFSVKQGHKVIARDADLMPLIDVNMCVMRGLRGEAPA